MCMCKSILTKDERFCYKINYETEKLKEFDQNSIVSRKEKKESHAHQKQ